MKTIYLIGKEINEIFKFNTSNRDIVDIHKDR